MDDKSKNIKPHKKRIANSDLDDSELTCSLSAPADDVFFRIVRSSSIASMISGLSDNHILEASDSFLHLSGYSRDEIIGRSLSEYALVLNPGENDPAVSILQKSKSAGKSKIKLKTKTGDKRLAYTTSNIIEINGQQCLLNYYEDIIADRFDDQNLTQSDRKRFHPAEQAMLDCEKKYRAIWENSPVGICLTDKDGIYHHVNPAYCRMYGYSEEELIGHCYTDLISSKKNNGNPLENYNRAFELGKITPPGKTQFIKKNGEKIWVQFTGDFIWLNDKLQFLLSMNIDITELMQAEEAIRESEEKYQLLIEKSNDAIYMIIYDKFKFVNRGFLELFNRTEEEILSPDFDIMCLVAPCSRPLIEERLKMIKQGKVPPNRYEYTAITKDGQEIQLEVSISYISYKGKKVIQGIYHDITQRKKAEDALKNSEERYRSVVENANEAILITQDDMIKYSNPKLKDITGYSEEDLTSKPVREFIHPDDREMIHNYYQKRLKGLNAPKRYSFKIIHKDKSIRWLEITSTMITWENKPAILSLLYDITERKKVEDALRNSEERYRSVIENAHEAILIAQDGVIKYSNPKMREISGYSAEELASKPFSEFIHPDDREMVFNYHKNRLKGLNVPKKYSFRAIRKDGRIRWLESTSTMIIWENKPASLNFSRDVTEEKQAELALKKEQEFINSLLDTANNLIVCLDNQARIIIFNREFEKVSGYSRDEVIGKSWPEIFLPKNHHHHALKDFAEWVRQHPRDVYEGPLKTKSGEIRTILWSNSALFYSDSDDLTAIAVGQDITKRKQAEEALRDSEETFRVISGSAQDAIVMIDSNDHITFWNKAAKDIFGYSENEVVGKMAHTLLAPRKYSQAIKQGFANFRKIGTGDAVGKTLELSALKKNGTEFPIEISVSSIMIKEKRHAVGIIRDITERKKAIEALMESEEKYRLLIENAGEPIFSVNSEGIFLTMNNAAAEYVGGKPEAFIGKTMWDIFPPHIAKQQMDNIKKAITTGKKVSTTTKTILQNEEKWFITNIQPISSQNGKTISALLIASDITEIKQLEIRGNVRSQLIDKLRSAEKINECLKFCCQAIEKANMFKRAVMTLHNKAKEIIHIGYVGLDEDLVKASLQAPAPDDKLTRKMTREKYSINHSYFIPVEEGLFTKNFGRCVPQQDNDDDLLLDWKKGDEFFVPIIGADNKPEGWLSVDTPFNGQRPGLDDAIYLEEIIEITGKKIHEIKNLELLKNERQALHDKNITLREVLSHIKKEKLEIKHQVADEIESILMPALKKLIKNDGTVSKTYFNILANHLQSLASTTGGIQHLFSKLSPREVEICNLIKNNASSKDIAAELHISLTTVQKHREIIRKKLGITNKNINLASFLKNQ